MDFLQNQMLWNYHFTKPLKRLLANSMPNRECNDFTENASWMGRSKTK